MDSVSKVGYLPKSVKAKVNSTETFSKLWAKKYVQKVREPENSRKGNPKGLEVVNAQRLLDSIRSITIQSWSKTEILLSQEVRRQGINYRLIDPWEITKDAYRIYEKVLLAYGDRVMPQRLAVFIASDLGYIRQKYTAIDPRVLGFVSMQFHYTGQLLLKLLPVSDQATVGTYFKVIDDHLYIPLQRLYEAAANYERNSSVLQILAKLLPVNSEIARKIVARTSELNPNYHCYSGTLSESKIESSSLRDVEMFQIYLCLCVLEQSIAPIQQELFPLCVMIYPTLKVRWELVRQMIHLIGLELRERLEPKQVALFMPYFQALWQMFSPDVFPDSLDFQEMGHSA